MTTTAKFVKKYPRALIRSKRLRNSNRSCLGTIWKIHFLRTPTETTNSRNLIGLRYSPSKAEQFAHEFVEAARNEPEPTA